MSVLFSMGNASYNESTIGEKTSYRLIRGKLANDDKHWGMRSNKSFLKIMKRGRI